MSKIPRQQVIPFSVPPGREVDLTFNTKYDHDKVTGVVLLPDKNVHGDAIFLEINRETILPRGFNAGLIAFQQFLNKDMRRNTYQFEEWARGCDARVIYKNNSARTVNIDMILFTVIGDDTPITKRKKLQIVPVAFTAGDIKTVALDDAGIEVICPLGYERCRVRTKTDFHFDELIAVFVDYYTTKKLLGDKWIPEELKKIISNFVKFYNETEKSQTVAELLQTELADCVISDTPPDVSVSSEQWEELRAKYLNFIVVMQNAIDKWFAGEFEIIARKDLNALQDAAEERYLYNDGYKSFSTFELSVDSVPFYPRGFPVAMIMPRYRKSFKETMCETSMYVKEADILIEFDNKWFAFDANFPNYADDYHSGDNNLYPEFGWGLEKDFSVYFLYNQTSKNKK